MERILYPGRGPAVRYKLGNVPGECDAKEFYPDNRLISTGGKVVENYVIGIP